MQTAEDGLCDHLPDCLHSARLGSLEHRELMMESGVLQDELGAFLDGTIQDDDERCEAGHPEVVLPRSLDLQTEPRQDALRSRCSAALGPPVGIPGRHSQRCARELSRPSYPQTRPCHNELSRRRLHVPTIPDTRAEFARSGCCRQGTRRRSSLRTPGRRREPDHAPALERATRAWRAS